jgi:hypothetical protein
MFDTGASSHMTPDRNCFESFSSVRGNVVLADKTQIEYTGVSLVRFSSRLPSGDISVVLLHRILFVPSLRKSLYSWNSVKSIEKFTLIDNGVLQGVRKLDRSGVINTFQSGNDFVLDLVLSETASLTDDTDYDFLHATLEVIRSKQYESETLRRWILKSRIVCLPLPITCMLVKI